jgi:hypothetical protein
MVPHAVTTFCDDVQYEIQGKMTLVGCYGTELISHIPPPFTLPKFGVVTHIRLPVKKLPKVFVRIYLPGQDDPILNQQIGQEESDDFKLPDAFLESLKDIPDPMPARMINFPFLFAPLVVERTGALRVRVLYGDKTVRADSLYMRYQAPQESPG